MKTTVLVAFLSIFLMGCTYIGTVLPPEAAANGEVMIKDSVEHEQQMPARSGSVMLPGAEIFGFEGNEPGWYTVDDNVMGGVSSSTVEILEPGVLVFTGRMSLENNGGFSSVRSEWSPTNLSRADGVLLRVAGDGKLYRLRIRSTQTGRDISYNASFETVPDTWKVIYIPFDLMMPTFRGFLMDVGTLDPATIASFGFMLSDKQPGEFGLRVDWIRAVSEEELRTYAGEASFIQAE